MVTNKELESLFQDIDENVPFLKFLGLTSDCFDVENACIRIAWRNEFMGHSIRKFMHGGMISAIMDITGAFLIILHYANNSTYTKKVGRTNTIDLRVDYLLPGNGRKFIASGDVLRMGKKVAVTRMEFHNDEQQLIAVATGTYTVG